MRSVIHFCTSNMNLTYLTLCIFLFTFLMPPPILAFMYSRKTFLPRVNYDIDELKKKLTTLEFFVTQRGGSQWGYKGIYHDHFQQGVYQCIVCKEDLFRSEDKYHSNHGYPCFTNAIPKKVVPWMHFGSWLNTYGARCKNCGANLGDVYDNGNFLKKGEERYIINSAAIHFLPY